MMNLECNHRMIDFSYDPDDYKYYKVTYEFINIGDEYDDKIESA